MTAQQTTSLFDYADEHGLSPIDMGTLIENDPDPVEPVEISYPRRMQDSKGQEWRDAAYPVEYLDLIAAHIRETAAEAE